jgi:hypothetical protein
VAGNATALRRISGAAEAQAIGTDILPIVFAVPMPAETGEPRSVMTGNGDGGAGAVPGQDWIPAQPLTMSSVWKPVSAPATS